MTPPSQPDWCAPHWPRVTMSWPTSSPAPPKRSPLTIQDFPPSPPPRLRASALPAGTRHAWPRPPRSTMTVGQGLRRRRPRRPARQARSPGGGHPPPEGSTPRIPADRRSRRHGSHPRQAPQARGPVPPLDTISRQARYGIGQPDPHRTRRVRTRHPGPEPASRHRMSVAVRKSPLVAKLRSPLVAS